MTAPSTVDRRLAHRPRRRAIVVTIVSLTVAATSVAFAPDHVRRIAQIELAFVGAIVVIATAGALRRAAPLPPRSPLDRIPHPPAPAASALPPGLVRISRRLAAGTGSAADARRHLGPLVGIIAADRLREHSHATVDTDCVFAQLPEPVAPEVALVLDPALADVDTRDLPGLDTAGIDALVRALEHL